MSDESTQPVVPPDLPPSGAFPWDLRAEYPGMDLTAIDALAVSQGLLPADLEQVPPEDRDGAGWAYPFVLANLYDRFIGQAMGVKPKTVPEPGSSGDPDEELGKLILHMIGYSYAMMVRYLVACDPSENPRLFHRQLADRLDTDLGGESGH